MMNGNQDFALALSLVRPVPLFTDEMLVLKQTRLTESRYGLVHRVLVMRDQDLSINKDLQRSLLRPSHVFTHDELVLKQTELTNGKYGSVRRVFIVCNQDYAIDEGQQRWVIEQNPPDEVKVINGTDHMVMFVFIPWRAFSTNFKPATAQNIDTHLTGPYVKAIQVKRHFVLVHGGSHGAWCWYKLSALLRFSGHNMTGYPPRHKVILVARRFGGVACSIATERFLEKISTAVLLPHSCLVLHSLIRL
ncbi:hypothetical protein TIFTF001_002601 [Ficus carica]|uniref:Uncharacterized protein n=1 Tax=Ficus carica TaxID=3494 RepID=A0AA88CSI5_FICCA|nr:hypothetical protein TIFTF001_002601 [Ficus carica]